MHLGLLDRPSFVPHNLVSTQEGPVPLLQFQMAYRQNLNVLWVQERNPDILFLFSQKYWRTNSFQVPQQGPYGKRYPFTGHLHLSRKPHINSSKGGPKKEVHLHVPKSGALMEADAHFRVLLNISFAVPSKGALPQAPLHGIPSQRDEHHTKPMIVSPTAQDIHSRPTKSNSAICYCSHHRQN